MRDSRAFEAPAGRCLSGLEGTVLPQALAEISLANEMPGGLQRFLACGAVGARAVRGQPADVWARARIHSQGRFGRSPSTTRPCSPPTTRPTWTMIASAWRRRRALRPQVLHQSPRRRRLQRRVPACQLARCELSRASAPRAKWQAQCPWSPPTALSSPCRVHYALRRCDLLRAGLRPAPLHVRIPAGASESHRSAGTRSSHRYSVYSLYSPHPHTSAGASAPSTNVSSEDMLAKTCPPTDLACRQARQRWMPVRPGARSGQGRTVKRSRRPVSTVPCSRSAARSGLARSSAMNAVAPASASSRPLLAA